MFEFNKNAKELGIYPTKKFRFVDDKNSNYTIKGDILELAYDNNTDTPFFRNLNRPHLGGPSSRWQGNAYMCRWDRMEYADQDFDYSKDNKQYTPKFKIGDVVMFHKKTCGSSYDNAVKNMPTRKGMITEKANDLYFLGMYAFDESDLTLVQSVEHKEYSNNQFNKQTKPKGKTIMSIITNMLKSKEDKGLEYFDLGSSKELNQRGREEFTNYLFANMEKEREGFLTQIVEAHEESKKC